MYSTRYSRQRRPQLSVESLERRDTPTTFLVTNLNDNAMSTPGDGTLRDAINQANSNPGADIIQFQAGLSGTLQAAAEFSITESVDIQGLGADQIIVNGFSTGTAPLFNNMGVDTTISGIRIQNHTNTGYFEDGGGVGNTSGSGLTLNNVIISGNHANYNFGIYNGGTLTITNSQILANTSGGILNDSGATLTVTDSTIAENEVTNDFGGGIASYGGTVTLTRVLVEQNSADLGGGIYVESTLLTIADSTIRDNTTVPNEVSADGGGLLVAAEANVSITNSAFIGNFADDFGGAIALGGDFDSNSPRSLTLTNVTLTNNAALTSGGAIGYRIPSPASTPVLRLTNVTAVRNNGGGAAINLPDLAAMTPVDALFTNSIIALNVIDNDAMGDPIPPTAAPDVSGAFTSAGGNLIQDISQAEFTPQATDLTGVDPLVGTLGDYGGLTQTIPLLLGSPALGLGVTGSTTPTTDQRGFARPVSGPIDAGAYQFRAPVNADDAYTTTEGQTLTVTAPGVLVNDVSPDGGTLTAVLVNGVPTSAGTLTFNSDGSFTFTPAAGFSGTTTFTYMALAEGRAGNPATVTIDVTAIPPVPPVPPVPPPVGQFAVAAGAGFGPRVVVYDTTGAVVRDFLAFEPAFSGGVRVALGDVNNDGVLDIIAGAGPGGAPRVRVFDGATGSTLFDFYAYEPSFSGGVYVAAGDVNNDGFADVVVGAGSLGSPRVRVYDGQSGAVSRDFFAYASDFRGGVRVAAGDLNGDGFAEIVTTPGASGGPHVRVYDGATGLQTLNFFAYDPAYRGGLYISVIPAQGDTPGSIGVGLDTFPEYEGSVFQALSPELLGTEASAALSDQQLLAPGRISIYTLDANAPTGVTQVAQTVAYDSLTSGARIGTSSSADGLAPAQIITAPGGGSGGLVKLFNLTTNGLEEELTLEPFGSGFAGSVFVG